MPALYKLLQGGSILRVTDGTSFRPDPANSDYRAYQAWVGAGNTADPADPAPLVYSGVLTLSGRVRTTDATPTEVYRATLAQLTGYRVLVTLQGVDAGNGAMRMTYASIVAKRLNAGALLVGSAVVISNHQDAAAASWALAASVSGNDVVITVTGAAGRTIDWLLDGHGVSFTPGGS